MVKYTGLRDSRLMNDKKVRKGVERMFFDTFIYMIFFVTFLFLAFFFLFDLFFFFCSYIGRFVK